MREKGKIMDQTNQTKKTIMISADHGLAIVYFLQTDVVKTLLEKGFRVVILTDDGVTEKMRERFQSSNLFFEGLRLKDAKIYFETVDHHQQYFDQVVLTD